MEQPATAGTRRAPGRNRPRQPALQHDGVRDGRAASVRPLEGDELDKGLSRLADAGTAISRVACSRLPPALSGTIGVVDQAPSIGSHRRAPSGCAQRAGRRHCPRRSPSEWHRGRYPNTTLAGSNPKPWFGCESPAEDQRETSITPGAASPTHQRLSFLAFQAGVCCPCSRTSGRRPVRARRHPIRVPGMAIGSPSLRQLVNEIRRPSTSSHAPTTGDEWPSKPSATVVTPQAQSAVLSPRRDAAVPKLPRAIDPALMPLRTASGAPRLTQSQRRRRHQRECGRR
jgi:hypothetical protein